MIITYYGASCFKVQSGDIVVAFNPPAKDSSFKSPRFQTDIALISSSGKDYNGAENLAGKNSNEIPFVIDGAGEYEVGGMHIKGIAAEGNTIYVLSLENINLCHLGALNGDVNADIMEKIGNSDVVFMPVGGETMGVVDYEKASGIAAKIAAKVIIPSQYEEKSLKQFIKEFGAGDVEPLDKFTFKKKDIIDRKGEVVILKPVV
ncbi:MAG: hypothetical protein COV02_01680 [Candidatus Terrybacteria bacterium CG10_big_fil_rev_8_21_14_0_10_41_10]|uniref:Lactamase n=1 Tax=Candidatus Terrybacteria bacterium CG10_big_fil_rev_8_21_14_0_10_41_10 TaxID=1975026 RepID=A0A2M8LAG5_9BACT|nr:MAG: hypothetical protein COV02_01680 [Candidatus Terrybacteria bacterium CG10_big_fil_rev_8_21_14_0_10_41_10]